MKAMLTAMGLALGMTLVVGCKGDEDRMVSLTIEKANAVEAAGGDCDKAGKALEEFNKANGKEYRTLRDKLKSKYQGEEGKKREAEIKAKYGDKLTNAQKTMTSMTIKCLDSDAYKKGIEAEKNAN